jgi:AraC family transcriptional regulator, regulatory protein of adaptative response / methylated-DNA-[protein]-cysteine methyltransferase
MIRTMGNRIEIASLKTPLGAMTAAATEEGICFLGFSDRPGLKDELQRLGRELKAETAAGSNPWFGQLETQLGEYFALSRRAFGIPLAYTGTAFQRSVWRGLESIPYGQTISYREEAAALGKPGSARAVAGANGQNRVMILIPCHRVIGADGSLSGYADGVGRKQKLIELEASGLIVNA